MCGLASGEAWECMAQLPGVLPLSGWLGPSSGTLVGGQMRVPEFSILLALPARTVLRGFGRCIFIYCSRDGGVDDRRQICGYTTNGMVPLVVP